PHTPPTPPPPPPPPPYPPPPPRALGRGGADYARPSWSQTGFLDIPRGADGTPGTPRNLFGFKDGTVNPRSDVEFDDQVWIGEDAASHPSQTGGTCMVIRRIVFDMPLWESADRPTRETSMGRTIVEGNPLSGEKEHDEPDTSAVGVDGLPVIDRNAHIALAGVHDGDTRQRMLRRAYNYDLPVTPSSADALLDAEPVALSDTGLIFTCFQPDPRTSFIPVQRRLAAGDRLNEWITHVGSAVFLIPAGTAEGEYWGEALLG
ncbi:MAG TPA: peroxidase, partial [Corynebacterium variabile]|nr:peroxidase [Corynebacterium variabile]